jgi:hypothetical protein
MRLPRAMSFMIISLSRVRATKEVALAEDSGRPKPALRPNASDGKQRRLSPRAEGRARGDALLPCPTPIRTLLPRSALSLSPKMLSRSVFSSVARASRSVRSSARPRLGNQPTPGMRRTGLTFPCCLSPCSSPSWSTYKRSAVHSRCSRRLRSSLPNVQSRSYATAYSSAQVQGAPTSVYASKKNSKVRRALPRSR